MEVTATFIVRLGCAYGNHKFFVLNFRALFLHALQASTEYCMYVTAVSTLNMQFPVVGHVFVFHDGNHWCRAVFLEAVAKVCPVEVA